MNINVNLMVENVTLNKSEVTINVDTSVCKKDYVLRMLFLIIIHKSRLIHMILKMISKKTCRNTR